VHKHCSSLCSLLAAGAVHILRLGGAVPIKQPIRGAVKRLCRQMSMAGLTWERPQKNTNWVWIFLLVAAFFLAVVGANL